MNDAGFPTEAIALIAAFSVGAQWLGWRTRRPALAFLGLAGLLLGPLSALVLGAPIVDPVGAFGPMLEPAIAVAVALILFEAGLNLDVAELRDSKRADRRLVLVGFPAAMVLGALAARLLLGLGWDLALLLGALLGGTAPSALAPLLRRARLSGRAVEMLRWEAQAGAAMGPLAAVLIYAAIRTAETGQAGFPAALGVGAGLAGGALLGAIAGLLLGWGLRRGHIPEFLKAAIVLALVLGVFALGAAFAQEIGFVAAASMGLVLANAGLAPMEELRRSRDSVAVLLVSGVFILLVAMITPAMLAALDWRVVLFAFAMLLLVRPGAMLLAMLGETLESRDRALVAGIGAYGMAPAVVAGLLGAELAGLGRAEAAILPLLALVVTFLALAAHWLGLRRLALRLGRARPSADGVLVVGASEWSVGLAVAIRDLGAPVVVADNSYVRLRPAREAGVTPYTGEILSEQAEHRLDHSELGHLVAATPNEAYNALVCVQFAPELGRHCVWQAGGAPAPDGRTIAGAARGRALIGPRRDLESLERDWRAGWRFHATRLSETYRLEHLHADRPDADAVIEQRPDGSLAFLGPKSPPRGLPGAVIVTFGPPRGTA